MQICTQTQMHSSLFLNGPSTSHHAVNSRKDAPTTPGQRLNANSILPLAKSTLQSIPCECIDCDIILNSWNTYTRHLQRVHHRRQTFDPVQVVRSQVFRCEWKRCAYRDYPTRGELLRHIEQTHLSHVSLPCPIIKCRETISRHQLFPAHFTEHHNELTNITITSTILKRSSSPTQSPPPGQHYNTLTIPLTSVIPTYTIRAPLVNPARSKLPRGPSLSHSQAFKRQHRHTRLQLSQVAQSSVVADEESDDVVDILMDDLCQENLQHEEIVIQPVKEMQMDKCLSCPVWIQDFSSFDIADSETIGIKVIESEFPLNT